VGGEIPRGEASVGVPCKNQSGVAQCCICELPVSLESAKADECGRAVHEECYALKMRTNRALSPHIT
jgi:hypothetical protein